MLETNTAAIGFCESRGWRRVGRVDELRAGEEIVAPVYAVGLT